MYPSMFHEWATLEIGARLPVGFSPEEWYQCLHDLLVPAVVQPVGYPIPAYRAEKNTALVRAFLASIRSQDGRPGFVVKTGTADLNIVAPAWGCPALAYGPGDSTMDHTPDEHICLDEYYRSIRVLENISVRST